MQRPDEAHPTAATVQGTSQDMLSEKSKGKQREASSASASAPSRSQSPTGTAGRPSSIKPEMAERVTRRDRVSVSSRMNKSIVVRPPYAAKDMLDFERRPRSNTVETTNMTEVSKSTQANSASGRHPGIQPSMHAEPRPKPDPAQDKEATHLTSSSNTAVDASANDQSQTQGQLGLSPERPSLQPRSASNDPSRWLSFTLPTKYRKRLDDYMAGRAPPNDAEDGPRGNSSSSDSEHESSADEYHRHYFGRNRRKRAEGQSRQNSGEYDGETGSDRENRRSRPRKPKRKKGSGTIGGAQDDAGNEGVPMTMRARVPDGMPISVNMGDTPGWNSPWSPHQPREGGSAWPGPVGVNRFASALNGNGDTASTTKRKAKKAKTRAQKFQHWLVRSAFAPLFFRILNLAFTASILGIAIHIHLVARADNVEGILGSSTIMAIIVGPLSIIHIFINVYAEYFGSPIGVWKVRSKMFYTFTDLIFICLWSGLLSLSFDDLFTSPAGCTAYTPNARFKSVDIGNAASNGSLADKLCDSQTALVSVVFVGLILYVIVLIVSLFRIFVKINRYN